MDGEHDAELKQYASRLNKNNAKLRETATSTEKTAQKLANDKAALLEKQLSELRTEYISLEQELQGNKTQLELVEALLKQQESELPKPGFLHHQIKAEIQY